MYIGGTIKMNQGARCDVGPLSASSHMLGIK